MRRLRLGAGVLVFSVLAVTALYFVLGLSEDPSLRWRHDFSEVGRNSLDPTTVDLLARLDEPVVAHVFFRRENSVKTAALDDARERVMDLLLVASKIAPDAFSFKSHDLGDIAAANAAMQRLDVNEVNTVVLEEGDRHVVLRLEPDICEVGRDMLDPRRYAVASFRGEEALVDGLLKVSSANRPKVLFTIGHSEPDPESDAPEGLSALVRALSGDGFDVGVWTLSEDAPLEGVDILAIVAPQDPFTDEELTRIHAFVDGGGRLFVGLGPALDESSGSVATLLQRFGMKARPGIVCLPVRDPLTGDMRTDAPACAQFVIEQAGFNSTHPITKALREAARKVQVLQSHVVERTIAPPGGVLQELLVQRAKHSWLDLPDPRGRLFVWDFDTEPSGPFSLAMSAELPVGEAEEDTRVVALGAASLVLNYFVEAPGPNRDFAMNCFNWLAERDFNVRLHFEPKQRAVLDVVRGTELLTLQRFAWYGLPGLLALIGLVLAWRRKH
jgi:hypothetical protein